jgi:hypothetical protein
MALLFICFSGLSVHGQLFQVEEDIRNEVTLPREVLSLLRQNDYVRESCIRTDEYKPKTEFSGKWFQAAKVDLNGDKQPDYVVKANEGCLFGANIGPFWVFTKGARGYKLVLQLHVLGMSIERRRAANGYRDIGSFAATATRGLAGRYVFDGRKYVKRSSREVEL